MKLYKKFRIASTSPCNANQRKDRQNIAPQLTRPFNLEANDAPGKLFVDVQRLFTLANGQQGISGRMQIGGWTHQSQGVGAQQGVRVRRAHGAQRHRAFRTDCSSPAQQQSLKVIKP